MLAILAFDSARDLNKRKGVHLFHELSLAVNAMEIMINQKEMMEEVVWQYLNASRNCFFIGRGVDYYVALEGALKLKEISYIQAEGFAGGELKHGTIALIEEGTPAIALLTQSHVCANMRSNVQEIMARGAHVCTISMEGMEQESDHIVLPHVHELLTPLVSVIPLQLIAYYAAKYRGCDIDKPRNLAKSVTVE
ncbi:Glutamine--fructose-6-phosphate aminotransferase [isomerizing] [compost metagenome]